MLPELGTVFEGSLFMPLDLTAEQKERGRSNFHTAVGSHVDRRDFMKGMLAAGAAVPLTAAAYFGYQQLGGKPVKAGLIGAGDEGGVLVGEHNPDYLHFIAYSDIRPSNQKRIFEGEPGSSPRKGFNKNYGNDTKRTSGYTRTTRICSQTRRHRSRRHRPAPASARPGGHRCPAGRQARAVRKAHGLEHQAVQGHDQAGRGEWPHASIGHQRHYSMLYAHANDWSNRAMWATSGTSGRCGTATMPHPGWMPTAIAKNPKPVWSSIATAGDRPFPQRTGCSRKQNQTARLQGVEELCPLAALRADRGPAYGGAGQPSTRRLQHLLGQGSSAGGVRRGRQVFL